MTDSRPEITVRTDGAFVVLTLARRNEHFQTEDKEDIPLSPEDAAWLGLELTRNCWHANQNRAKVEQRKAETWRDKEALL